MHQLHSLNTVGYLGCFGINLDPIYINHNISFCQPGIINQDADYGRQPTIYLRFQRTLWICAAWERLEVSTHCRSRASILKGGKSKICWVGEQKYLRNPQASLLWIHNHNLSDLKENIKWTNERYDPKQPHDTLIAQVNDAVGLPAHTKTLYTDEQWLNTAYNPVFQTGVFTNDIKEWWKWATTSKAWTKFPKLLL